MKMKYDFNLQVNRSREPTKRTTPGFTRMNSGQSTKRSTPGSGSSRMDTAQQFKTPTTKKIKIIPSGKENRTPYTKTARTRTQDTLQPFGETRQKQDGSDGVTGVPGRQQDPAAWRRSKYGKEVMGIKNSRLKRLDWGKLINMDEENIPSKKDKK